MNAGKQKIVETCPNCKAPQNEHRLTCRRCGHYLHDKDGSMVGSPAIGALLGLCMVALIVGFCCFLLLRPKPPEAPTAGQTTGVQDTAAVTQQPTGRRHRHRR